MLVLFLPLLTTLWMVALAGSVRHHNIPSRLWAGTFTRLGEPCCLRPSMVGFRWKIRGTAAHCCAWLVTQTVESRKNDAMVPRMRRRAREQHGSLVVVAGRWKTPRGPLLPFGTTAVRAGVLFMGILLYHAATYGYCTAKQVLSCCFATLYWLP